MGGYNEDPMDWGRHVNIQNKSNSCGRFLAGLCALACGLSGAVAGEMPAPGFDAVFGSGMVLPAGKPVTLRGHAAPNERLTLQLDGQRYTMRGDATGQWRVQVAPLRAGGPYTLELRDEHGAGEKLEDVLAGQVWLCSGQSNMEFPVAMSTDQPAAAMQGNPAIRLLSIAHQTALQARATFTDAPTWQVATADTIKDFSAVCYFFAQQKIALDGVPIGLIDSSWGGSAIEPWISEQTLSGLPDYRQGVELLRQYRDNRRKADLAFADDWVRWWNRASSMGPVWQRGVLDKSAAWRDAPLADWRTYPDPRLKTFTGNLWFSRSFQLSAAQARQGASFVLGRIDEVDSTWLNGKFVGNTFGYGTRREYRLQPGMLRPGINQFSVFVTNTYDAGGMTGPEGDIGIRFDDGQFVPLGSNWKYLFVPKQTGYPPRAPWESVSGLSGMFNGMIAPLQALVPTGVIWYQGESNADKAGGYGELLTSLISDWRGYFGSELPFIVVQLPNYGAVASAPAQSGWATLRNAQQQVALHDPGVGLVVTQDLGDDANIHPRLKYAVARRAVQVAQAMQASGPVDGVVPHLIARNNDRLTLDFLPSLTISVAPQPVAGFSLCGADTGSCVAAHAEQRGSRVQIDRAALPAATRLRYCWSDGGVCALRSLDGLPVASFELSLGESGK
jgi:sialate O-acetylesterase